MRLFHTPRLNRMPWYPKLHNQKSDDEKRIRLFPDINRFSRATVGIEFNRCHEQKQRKDTYHQKLDAPIFGRITVAMEFFENDS